MNEENFDNGEWVELNLGHDFKVSIWIKCDSDRNIKDKRIDAFNKIVEKITDKMKGVNI